MDEDNKVVLSPEELDEIARRNNVLALHQSTVSLLTSEKNLFLSHLLTEKGLDPNKQYTIDKDGTLTETE